MAGIAPGPKGAYSIALSGGYDDDVDLGYGLWVFWVVYLLRTYLTWVTLAPTPDPVRNHTPKENYQLMNLRWTRPERNKGQAKECVCFPSLWVSLSFISFLFLGQLRTAPQSSDQSFENNFNLSLLVCRFYVFTIPTLLSTPTEILWDQEASPSYTRLQVTISICTCWRVSSRYFIRTHFWDPP